MVAKKTKAEHPRFKTLGGQGEVIVYGKVDAIGTHGQPGVTALYIGGAVVVVEAGIEEVDAIVTGAPVADAD